MCFCLQQCVGYKHAAGWSVCQRAAAVCHCGTSQFCVEPVRFRPNVWTQAWSLLHSRFNLTLLYFLFNQDKTMCVVVSMSSFTSASLLRTRDVPGEGNHLVGVCVCVQSWDEGLSGERQSIWLTEHPWFRWPAAVGSSEEAGRRAETLCVTSPTFIIITNSKKTLEHVFPMLLEWTEWDGLIIRNEEVPPN